MSAPLPAVRMLGTRGVPASHGGFETAAENIAQFLIERGWRVVVYCQVQGAGRVTEDTWNGIERVLIPIEREGPLGTVRFDLASIRHAIRHHDLCLTFGYNTAMFNIAQRLHKIPNVINMDGIEWSRERWGPMKRSFLWTNERVACAIGTHLIADHPCIRDHLARITSAERISMIAYGAHAVTSAPAAPVKQLGLEPGRYITLICRAIAENSILELVQAFSAEPRGYRLAILGRYTPDSDAYHRAVMRAASDDVLFLGTVYDPVEVAALRFHGVAYLHGHTVGGTNPSLVEALAVGNAVIAHDNDYNRWVAQDGALYFRTSDDAAACLDEILGHPARREQLAAASRARHAEAFTWEGVALQYEELLTRFLPRR